MLLLGGYPVHVGYCNRMIGHDHPVGGNLDLVEFFLGDVGIVPDIDTR